MLDKVVRSTQEPRRELLCLRQRCLLADNGVDPVVLRPLTCPTAFLVGLFCGLVGLHLLLELLEALP